MCVVRLCWRIKLGIIETHDSIPNKLLNKGLGFFSIHPHTHTRLLLFFLKAVFEFDPTLHRERRLCQSLCLSHSPALCLHHYTASSFYTPLLSSMSNCLLGPAELQSAWRTLSQWGRNVPRLKNKARKRKNWPFCCVIAIPPPPMQYIHLPGLCLLHIACLGAEFLLLHEQRHLWFELLWELTLKPAMGLTWLSVYFWQTNWAASKKNCCASNSLAM